MIPLRACVVATLLGLFLASPSTSHAGLLDDIKKVGKSVEKGVSNLGKEVEKGVRKTGKGIEKGVNQLGKEVEKGVNNAGKEIGKGVTNVAKETGKGLKKLGKEVEKGVNNAGKEIGKGVTNVAKETGKGLKKLGKGTEHVLDEALRGADKLIKPFEKALCDLAGAKQGENCNINVGVAVDSNGSVVLTDSHGNAVPRPSPPPDAPSVELKTIVVVDPDNDDVLFVGVEAPAAGDGDATPLPDRIICRGAACVGVVPADGSQMPERSIAFVETTVDLISLSIGIHEWNSLPEDASLREKFEVGGAVLVDATAAVVPIVPGGASLVVRASNRLEKVAKVTTKALDKVPGNWVVKMPRNHDGVKFVKPGDSHTHIRFKLDGTVRAQKDGKALDRVGRTLPSSKSPDAHFSTEEFLENFPINQL